MEYSELFRYEDGKLFWKVSPSRKVRAGDPAGSMGKDYMRVGHKGPQPSLSTKSSGSYTTGQCHMVCVLTTLTETS